MSRRRAMLKYSLTMIVVCLLGTALAGCSFASPTSTPALTQETTTTSVSPTDTAIPSPTPTSSAPVLILLAPSGVDPDLSNSFQTVLNDLAAQEGYRFQVRPSLSQDDLLSAEIVVALPPATGLTELAASHPEIRFLAVGYSDLEPSTNLTVIQPQAERPDQVGFLAGYTAAAITLDWRVAVLTAAGSPAGDAIRQGFTNGVFYYCGLCRPVYPPFPITGYPITFEITASSGPADWQAIINNLLSWDVGTVFVDPAIADEKLLVELANSGIHMILMGQPPQGMRDQWVASIGAGDPALTALTALPGFVRGEEPANQALQLGFTETNPNLLSPGKQSMVEEMLADLLAGYIDTGAAPEGQ